METRPVKIFASGNMPRLNYIAEIILTDILGLSWEIITDKRKLGKNPVINYSQGNIPGALKIFPDSLLFEDTIRDRDIVVTKWNELPVFFQSTSDSDIPFDIFAASFYLITRYEEYLEFQPDEFDRYRASDSLAFRHGFLRVSLIERWTKAFARILAGKFRTMAFKPDDYRAIAILDVCDPFAGQEKNFLENLTGFIKDLTGRKGHPVSEGNKDSETTGLLDYISDTVSRYSAESKFCFSVGDNAPPYDRNPSWRNSEYRKLICSIGEKFNVGIHTSVNASLKPSVAVKEISRLKAILKKDVLVNHFSMSRIIMPSSYRNICDAGITEDYSMGYPDEPGFRAGISRPFWFYNLPEEQVTGLRIIPFQIMDITLSKYKKLDPAAAKEIIHGIISETRSAGGQFVSIWHDLSFPDNWGGCEWREIFEYTLEKQIR